MITWIDVVFYAANVFFLFVTLVFLLTFLENRGKALKNPKPKRFPTLSVIIPARNESANIKKTIESVLALEYPKPFEVIVVNHSSTDDTLAKARSALRGRKNARVITAPPGGGKAAALNAGLRIAKGELVATVDADSFPEPNALLKMIGYFNDPKVAAVTASVKVNEPRSFLQFLQFVEYVSMNYLRKTASFLQGISCTPGPLSVFRASVLREAGGFEYGNVTEDTEIALRLQSRGYKIENAFNAVAHSVAPYSLRGLVKQRVRWYHGALINAKKYSFVFFNTRYGSLGWFILPTNFIAVVLAIFVLFRLALLTWQKLVFVTAALLSTHGGTSETSVNVEMLAKLFFNPNQLLTVDVIFVFFYLVLVVFGLWLSFRAAGEKFKIKMLPTYIIYLFLYSFLVTGTWVISILHALTRKKPVWENAKTV